MNIEEPWCLALLRAAVILGLPHIRASQAVLGFAYGARDGQGCDVETYQAGNLLDLVLRELLVHERSLRDAEFALIH